MSDITLKITVKQQLPMLGWLFIVYTAIGTAAIYFFAFKMNTALLYVFLGFFLLDGLPAFLVHMQYWLTNRHTVLKIDKEYQRLTHITTNEMKVYRFEDIALLQHVASYGGGSWYSFSEYRYFKITFNDKSEIVITCLMLSNIKERFDLLLGRKAVKKLKIVAFIK